MKNEEERIITRSKNYEQMQKYNHLQYYDSTNTLLENEVLRCGRQVACIYALLETVVPTKSCLSETLTCVERPGSPKYAKPRHTRVKINLVVQSVTRKLLIAKTTQSFINL